jgi:hypothetical protein
MDIINPQHEALADHLFGRVCAILGMRGFILRPLRRRKRGVGRFRSITYGYTKIGESLVTIDLYTPKTMQPRKMDAILRVICHELAHHQSPPALYRVGWRLVRLIHHPKFWAQYKENVSQCCEDEVLGVYFSKLRS